MQNFTLHQFQIKTQVLTPLQLNQHHGSALRGALFHALRGPDHPTRDGYTGYCTNKAAPSCWQCTLHHACPVSTLVSTLDQRNQGHGRNLPRPYIIRSLPTATTHYQPGHDFTFYFHLCAQALRLFPYVILALERLQHEGLGKRIPHNHHRRGTLQIKTITAIHPLTNQQQPIHSSHIPLVNMPDLPITHAHVLTAAANLPTTGSLSLHFHTPTRLIHQKKLLKVPHFRPLIHRLITRLEQLSSRFCDTPLQLDVPALLHQADQVKLIQNDTTWSGLHGYSTRRQRETLLSGLTGTAIYHSPNWQPFLPWLIWGSLLGVGKNTVKGDGWYTIS